MTNKRPLEETSTSSLMKIGEDTTELEIAHKKCPHGKVERHCVLCNPCPHTSVHSVKPLNQIFIGESISFKQQ